MNIISFSWTTPALLAGRKTVTRRDWIESHARKFKAGYLVAGYDLSPRIHGKKVAIIRLTADPYRENTADIPDSDYEAEGFKYLEENYPGLGRRASNLFWHVWKETPITLWVVRFEVVKTVFTTELGVKCEYH